MERRSVLRALAATGAVLGVGPLLAACTSDSPSAAAPSVTPSSSHSPTPEPRAVAAALETTLLTYAERVLARFPGTANVVQPVRDGHAAHVVALVATTPSATPPTDVNDPRLSGTAGGALRQLALQERAAARQHAAAAGPVEATTARLLASIAAFAAAQDVVLTRSAR